MANKSNEGKVKDMKSGSEIVGDLLDSQLKELVEEHRELTERANEYAQVIDNINVRLAQIKGGVDALKKLKDEMNSPKNVIDALAQGMGVMSYGPDGPKMLDHTDSNENGDSSGDASTNE